MRRLPFLIGMLALSTAMLVGNGSGQDTKQDKKDEAKKDGQPGLKGQMPPGWAKLGLSTDQKKKVQAVMGSYKAKITALQEQIDGLKKEEYAEAFKVLTDDQKATLRRMSEEKTDPGKAKDKKDKA